MLTYGELFAGYDGLGMGVRSVLGGETRWVSEIDKAPSRILAHHNPNIPNLGDITAIDFAQVEPVDVITGGFPCQDVSHAGRRAGLIRDGEGRTRSGLWGHMLRAVATIRPRLVVAENVRGLLSAKADSDVEPCPWCMGDDQTALCGHSEPYSQTWPTSGMTRRGTAYALPTWEQRTAGSESSSSRCLPTPTTRDWKDSQVRREPHRPDDTDTLSRAPADLI